MGNKATAQYLSVHTCVHLCLCCGLRSDSGNYDLGGTKFTCQIDEKSQEADMKEWLIEIDNDKGLSINYVMQKSGF